MKIKHVEVGRDLFEWMVEYALELRGERNWKRGTSKRNDEEMDGMDQHINEALRLRDEPSQPSTKSDGRVG
jgi:hypothetical protein